MYVDFVLALLGDGTPGGTAPVLTRDSGVVEMLELQQTGPHKRPAP